MTTLRTEAGKWLLENWSKSWLADELEVAILAIEAEAAREARADEGLREALRAFGERLAAEGYGWEAIITREGPNGEETVAHLTTANPDPERLPRADEGLERCGDHPRFGSATRDNLWLGCGRILQGSTDSNLAYRCAECRTAFCEDCIKQHFGWPEAGGGPMPHDLDRAIAELEAREARADEGLRQAAWDVVLQEGRYIARSPAQPLVWQKSMAVVPKKALELLRAALERRTP